jgi:hypothetical protein
MAEAIYLEHEERRLGCEGANARGVTINSNYYPSGVTINVHLGVNL